LKILILKPSSLGDVIHALPVLRLLKLHLPQSEIFWWLDINLIPLLEGDPDLSGILPFQRKRWAAPSGWTEIVASLHAMREKKFDWAIDLQGLARSAIFTWLSNAGLSIGLDNPREGAREGARGAYDLIAPRSPVGTHAVDRYLSVLPMLDVPVRRNFEWLPVRSAAAASVNEKWNPGSAPWIIFLPGARWDNKRWPAQNFIELVNLLRRNPELKVAILGSREDFELGRAIAAANPGCCLNLAGQTSMSEMIEWIRLSRLVITNDTGPMHVAAALAKPVVAIFGPTDPRSTGPYRQSENVLQDAKLPCVPCMKSTCVYAEPLACLHAITPAMVYEKSRVALPI